MKKKLTRWKTRLRRRAAAALTEYTFIVGIISIAGVVLLAAIGSATRDRLEDSSKKIFPDE